MVGTTNPHDGGLHVTGEASKEVALFHDTGSQDQASEMESNVLHPDKKLLLASRRPKVKCHQAMPVFLQHQENYLPHRVKHVNEWNLQVSHPPPPRPRGGLAVPVPGGLLGLARHARHLRANSGLAVDLSGRVVCSSCMVSKKEPFLHSHMHRYKYVSMYIHINMYVYTKPTLSIYLHIYIYKCIYISLRIDVNYVVCLMVYMLYIYYTSVRCSCTFVNPMVPLTTMIARYFPSGTSIQVCSHQFVA